MSTDGGDMSIGNVSGSFDLGAGVDRTHAELEKLRADLERIVREANDTEEAMQMAATTPGPAWEQMRVKLEALRGAEQGLRAEVKQAEAALGRQGQAMRDAATTTTSVSVGMNGVAQSSGNAGMKLLLLGQFVDDMQFGLKAVVNNVPQVAMAFGGSAGLAGGLGIAAVVLNQFLGHWDQMRESFKDTDWFPPVDRALRGLKDSLREFFEYGSAIGLDKIFGHAGDAAKAALDKAAADAKATLEGIEDPEVEGRRKAVREGIAASGGGVAARDALAKQIQKAAPGVSEKDAREQATKQLGELLKGGEGPLGEFMKNFGATTLGMNIDEALPGNRKARAEGEKAAEQELKDARARADERQRDYDRYVGERAKAFGGGELGQRAIAGTLTEGGVRKALEKSGVDAELAVQQARDVLQRMQEAAQKAVDERATAKGFTPAEARSDLAEDFRKRREAEAKQFAQRGRAEIDESVGKAREAVPLLDERVNRELMHTPGAPEDADAAVTERLRQSLVGQGVGAEDAAKAAGELVRQQRRQIDEMVAKVQMGGPAAMEELMGGGEPKRQSQTMDTMSFARSIQAGVVPNDAGQKQVERLDRLITIQNQLLNWQRNNRNVAVFG